MFPALVIQQFDPFIMERPCTIIVFSVCKYGFQLAGSQIWFKINFSDKRSNHHAFMFCRKIQEDRKPFIRPHLILCRHIDGNILPSVQPALVDCVDDV